MIPYFFPNAPEIPYYKKVGITFVLESSPILVRMLFGTVIRSSLNNLLQLLYTCLHASFVLFSILLYRSFPEYDDWSTEGLVLRKQQTYQSHCG